MNNNKPKTKYEGGLKSMFWGQLQKQTPNENLL